jgi:dTDP-4-amino-4,6-dideoxygalactose transaminase
MTVPFIDLKKQYQSLKPQLDKAWHDVVGESAFIRSRYVEEFEKAFAAKLGVKHCIGVANGTDAIYITLKMLGIGAGDEVITVANSWISSSETITQAGARAVFTDIEPGYYCIDAATLEKNITPRTRAVVAVHLYGQACDLEKISELCRRHNIYLVEDCAQAHFTMYKEKPVGTFGIAATYSFYPGKNLGAYGDAGAVVCNDDALAANIRRYANHGALVKHQHQTEGINSRLDGLQAAILSAKLPHLSDWNEKRRAHAAYYSTLLGDVSEIDLPLERPSTRHTWHLYVIRAKERDALQLYLKEQGIETQIHYPTPLPLLPAYSYLGKAEADFPIASAYRKEILSLPMYPEMTREEIGYVAGRIKQFYAGS